MELDMEVENMIWFIGLDINRIRYLMGIESGITYIISHNYPRIKVDSYDSLPSIT